MGRRLRAVVIHADLFLDGFEGIELLCEGGALALGVCERGLDFDQLVAEALAPRSFLKQQISERAIARGGRVALADQVVNQSRKDSVIRIPVANVAQQLQRFDESVWRCSGIAQQQG